jgi:putative transposase
MISFITGQRGIHAVETICRVLPIAPGTYYEHARRAVDPELLPDRAKRDVKLLTLIREVWEESLGRYGVRKVWHELLKGNEKKRRQPVKVARCTVERLMREHGLKGVSRGRKRVFTTISSDGQEIPTDLVKRDFKPGEPNKLWVSDLTCVRTPAASRNS